MKPISEALSKPEAKTLLRWAVLFVLLTVAVGLQGIWHGKRTQQRHAVVVSEDGQTPAYAVTMAGRTMVIPKVYFAMPPEDPTDIIYMRVALPDLRPLKLLSDAELATPGSGLRVVSILGYDTSHHTDLDFRFTTKDAPFYLPEERELLHGLRHIELFKDTKDNLFFDLYYARNEDGSLQVFLRCTPRHRAANPMCQHNFQEQGILYSLSYSKLHMAQWPEIQEGVLKLMAGFEGHMTHESPPT